MCGIFGFILKEGATVSPKEYHQLITSLFKYSESRGKESAGIHYDFPQKALTSTVKSATAAKRFTQSDAFKQSQKQTFTHLYSSAKNKLLTSNIVLAHSRLVTNGSAQLEANNQPVTSGQVTVVHNGIIVNADALWQDNPTLQRTSDVDTEILAALLNHAIEQDNDVIQSVKTVYEQIKGSASIAWVSENHGTLTLSTNTGDLYYLILPDSHGLVFASERYILEQSVACLKNTYLDCNFKNHIQWLKAGTGLLHSIDSIEKPVLFSLPLLPELKHTKSISVMIKKYDTSLLRYDENAVKVMKRCSRCVLPETFPFIHFDNQGVCNYCRHYKPRYQGMHVQHTKQAFIDSLSHYKKNSKEPNVIIPFSGGRDSSYGLHLICKEFGLNPITFTYDWGMVTDLARRNIARVCGQLGVPNILFSANIQTKRKNIRNNVSAWLKKPDLGMIPLFMAGDKSFFRIVNQLKQQTAISLNLWCANPLENTDFKSGFCGISPDFNKKRLDYLSFTRKAKLARYYASRYIKNPSYINTSLLDTAAAFWAYYIEPRNDFYFIFDHFIWDEKEVNETLLSIYDWEVSPDSTSTWRIGDGTAPFYNYIYNTAYGFSEFDTFRSNQIRENMISREEALASICVENRPRETSLAWYLDTIGIDFNQAIQRINALDVMGIHAKQN